LNVGKRIYWESGLAASITFAALLLVTGSSEGIVGLLQLYAVHVLTAFLLIALMSLALNAKILMFAGLISSGSAALYLKNASYDGLKHTAIAGQRGLHVAHINLSLVTDIESVYEMVSDTSIDIISFQEFTPDWATMIPSMMDSSFIYRYEDVRMDLYGKAVYSVYPLISASKSSPDGTSLSPEITVTLPATKIRLLTPYLTPALDRRSGQLAKEQLQELGRIMEKDTTPTIVMGEFNQVYWSKDILQFRKKTSLLNSRLEVSPARLKMPFDHIFYTSNMACLSFEEINDNLGNHIGCRARLIMQKNGRKNE
jgi:hypothetical protein